MKARQFQQDDVRVQFAGRCDSACTIYLSLPSTQTCLAPDAAFGFHSPHGATAESSQAAETYLLEQYPDWVTNWIDSQGGLSRKIMTMDHDYASQYLRPCETSAEFAMSLVGAVGLEPTTR